MCCDTFKQYVTLYEKSVSYNDLYTFMVYREQTARFRSSSNFSVQFKLPSRNRATIHHAISCICLWIRWVLIKKMLSVEFYQMPPIEGKKFSL